MEELRKVAQLSMAKSVVVVGSSSALAVHRTMLGLVEGQEVVLHQQLEVVVGKHGRCSWAFHLDKAVKLISHSLTKGKDADAEILLATTALPPQD